MYQERFYRDQISSKFKLEVSHRESDLLVGSDQELNKSFVKELLLKYYRQIEAYIEKNSGFLKSLSPIEPDNSAPPIVREMIEVSYLTGIGPFSAVAGATALYVGRELLTQTQEVVVENGGDIFLKINRDKLLGVYLGEKFDLRNITLKVKSRGHAFGIASSSAAIGHSLNFGKADLVTVVAKDSIIADSFATALSNRIQKEADARQVVEFSKNHDLIEAILVAFEGKIFLWGDLEVIG